MPGVDPYFSTNSYSTFVAWIDTTRLRLLNLNKYTPANHSTKHFLNRLKNVSVVKLKTLANANRAQQESSISKIKTKNAQNITSNISSNVSSYSKEAIEIQKAEFKTKIKKIKDTFLENKLKAEKEIILELSKKPRAINEGEAGNVNKNVVDRDTQPIPDYLNYDYIKNDHTYPSDPNAQEIFPKAGKDVTTAITDEILRPGRVKYNFFSNGEQQTEYRGWIKMPGSGVQSTNSKALDKLYKAGKAITDATKFFGSRDTELSEYSKEILNNGKIISPTGTYKFFIEKLHGRHYSDGAATPYTLGAINETQGAIYKAGGDNFSNRKVFAAFIDNYNDNYNVEWSSYNFLGRGEKSYAYSSTERKITMEFTILTDHALEQLAAIDQLNDKIKSGSQDDILSFLLNEDTIHWGKGTYNHDHKQRLNGATSTHYDTAETTWQKLTFLAQCCYPYYRTDGKMKEQPLVRMRIADFYDVVCMFNSLDVQLNPFDVPYIDFNTSSLGEQPVGFKVTISATIIHDYEPSSQFYGFYHRKQFDNKDAEAAYQAKVWGIGLTKNADLLTNILQKKSPVSIKDVLNTKNFADLLKSTDFQEIQNDIKAFKENFKGYKDKSVNLFEKVRKLKLKNIFDAIKSVQNRTEFFKSLESINKKLNLNLDNRIDSIKNISEKYDVTQSKIDNTKNLAISKVKDINKIMEENAMEKARSQPGVGKPPVITIPKTIGQMVEQSKQKTQSPPPLNNFIGPKQ